MIGSKRFDPSAVRTISFDWCRWPGFPPGTSIASVQWSVPGAFEVLDQSITGKKANIKVRCTALAQQGSEYQIECHMVTSENVANPTQDSRRIGLLIAPR